MNCPNCDTQLRKLSQHWSEEKTNTIVRHVICDIERGGCNHSFWYEKEYTSVTRDLATKRIITMTKSKPRRGVVHADVAGSKEITPCDCPDCLDPKERGWHNDKEECLKKKMEATP